MRVAEIGQIKIAKILFAEQLFLHACLKESRGQRENDQIFQQPGGGLCYGEDCSQMQEKESPFDQMHYSKKTVKILYFALLRIQRH